VEEFHIRNVPTIVIVGKNGEPIRKIIGLVQEQELINIIKDTVQYEL
jgi:thioredoxin-related protein